MKKEKSYTDYMNHEDDDLNIKEEFEKYLAHWRWFLLSLCICLILVFIYLKYVPRSYEVTTTILVKDKKKGGMLSNLSAFTDLGLGNDVLNNIDNEIEILKSRTLIESTIKKLNLNIALFAGSNFISKEIYEEKPLKIYFISKTALFNTERISFHYKVLTDYTFELLSDDKIDQVILSPKRKFKYGDSIPTTLGVLVIDKVFNYRMKEIGGCNSIKIVITPFDNLVDEFKRRLKVEPVSKASSVVAVSISDPVIKKAEIFLNTLIQIYNEKAVEDKNYISESTSKFISNRLAFVTQELDGVEQNIESFKKSNKLIDIESETEKFINTSSGYNKKEEETEIQLNIVSSFLDFLKINTNYDLLPSNLIMDNGGISTLISSYNQLVLDRSRILKSATAENPSIVKLDQQIVSLKAIVEMSLNRIKSNLRLQNTDLKSQEEVISAKISKIPVQERQFRVIARQQKVKEELYLYLLQKREEIAISVAVTDQNASVIDLAKPDRNAVNPKGKIIYMVGIFFGLVIPFGFIYISDLFDTKIKSKLDLDRYTKIPFIGEIPISYATNHLIKSDSKTSFAEALRIVRTNLEFMLNKAEKGIAKTIFVTSTLALEGKTFIAANIASTLSLSGSRVLLIGLDIRNPKLGEYIDVPNLGVTNYLSIPDSDIQNYIIKVDGYPNFFVLPSGIIPPNPAELLMDKKIDYLFEKLKKEYDYIIVDTAPVSLVTDTLLIAKHAEIFLYVIRANFLEKRLLSIPNNYFKEKKLPNMCIVLNDTNGKQGYTYGYGEKVEVKTWFKRIISKFR
ncbi:polysaccharide biosynthesis tyrosine autokinase [Flavobacterium sp. LC2016-12]|uniref:GumC family protein n=1 Tax=Flavobacterium sp. LC2016-12 TaxID=2783794 RepID=UPI00188C3FC1|nr:polysaccharide biosynthesis tyrosine autokinase [Flavobacterium sp. LC2016-12]MBF4467287.1 polysaccharide biosynthesis tyrosine autokinase [Flavobacterium sp. LC2016-12]